MENGSFMDDLPFSIDTMLAVKLSEGNLPLKGS